VTGGVVPQPIVPSSQSLGHDGGEFPPETMQNLSQQICRISTGGDWVGKAVARRPQLPGWTAPRRRRANFGGAGSGPQSAADVARRSRLEAVIFLSREPVSLRKLAQLANLTDATEARTLLNQLSARYDERGCAFQVAQVAGGYQLLSRREFASWLRPQAAEESEIRLSAPALETLAVVAYRQPVLRAQVEAIRGVACGDILRQLLDRDLLRIVGRSDDLGRPLRYGTTKRFLQLFGLSNLDQLPWAQQLRESAAPAETDNDRLAPGSGLGSDLTDNVEAA
jgi:segregation and condensation protein B